MPWKESTKMEQRIAFIHDYKSGVYTFSSLCLSYGISRQTGYNLVRKFKRFGIDGLDDIRSRPHSQPNATSCAVVNKIVELRTSPGKEHWGARKIAIQLRSHFGAEQIPSIVTINNILRREGLIIRRKRRRRVTPLLPIFDPKKCNEIWSADYKGKFRLGNSKYCHPLTIADSCSRFVLRAKGMYHERFSLAKPVFREVFREFGMPLQLHTDNGSPFGSVQSPGRFGRLSYWLIDLGIQPVFSDPGCPQQNGRHERMHHDLKRACTHPVGKDLRTQNRKLNEFVRRYNHERPHEALDMATPAARHTYSKRVYPERIKPAEYDQNLLVKRVTKSGGVRWGSYEYISISECLAGKHIGFERTGGRSWRVYYRDTLLGHFSTDKEISPGKYHKLRSDA